MKILRSIALILILFLLTGKPVYAATNVPILLYHYIGDNPNPRDTARNALTVKMNEFQAQMKYLKDNGYTPITLDTLNNAYSGKEKLPNRPIVLTFDDGYYDFYVNAFPVLKKYKFHAVSFIPTGLVGVGNNFHMNWIQIKEINKSGLVAFESHGVSHSNLAGLNGVVLNNELITSKKVLESQLHKPVNFIAYPYGISSYLVQNSVQRDHYAGAVGTWRGDAAGINMNMPRIKVSGYTTLNQFISSIK